VEASSSSLIDLLGYFADASFYRFLPKGMVVSRHLSDVVNVVKLLTLRGPGASAEPASILPENAAISEM